MAQLDLVGRVERRVRVKALGHLVRRRPREVRRPDDDQVPIDIHDPELGGTQEAVRIDHRVGIDEGPGSVFHTKASPSGTA